MNTIHALLDTKAKRELVFCLLVFGLVAMECYWNGVFLWRVSGIIALEDLYDLIPIARLGLIGRFILSIFEATSLRPLAILTSIAVHLNWHFVFVVGLIGYVLLARQSSRMFRITKRVLGVIVVIQTLAIVIVSVYVVMHLSYTTYGVVLRQVQANGLFLLVIQVIGFILSLLAMVYLGYRMIEAMQYRAVELIDEVSIAFDVVEEDSLLDQEKSSREE